MGDIVQLHRFFPNKTEGLLKPIIYCYRIPAIEEKAFSMNRPLSQALVKYRPEKRTMQIEKCFADVIADLPDNPIIKDFDVLFNPEYKVDVLNIMVNVCKKKSFSAVWPGRLDGNRLIYAEEQFRDYKEYDIGAYDITCVIVCDLVTG